MAVDLIKTVEVESDSAIAVNFMVSTDFEFYPLTTLIANCSVIMQLLDSCHLHYFHNAMTVADMLAKDSIAISRGAVVFSSPLAHIARLVYDDIA